MLGETMIGTLFVIATRIENPNQIGMLQTCVDSIKKHFGPTSYIVVVDSNSPCRDHIDLYKNDFYVEVADIRNKNYEAGAWLWAYQNRKAHRYVFLHDSCEVVNNFSEVFDKELTIWNSMDSWDCIIPVERTWVETKLGQTPWAGIPESFTMIQGSIFTAKRPVLDKLYTRGLQLILPTNKPESRAFERLLGIVLTLEGYAPIMKDITLKSKVTKTFAARE